MQKNFLFLLCSFVLSQAIFAQRSSENPYDEVSIYFEGLAKVKLDDKFGFINEQKKEVIDIRYKKASFFSEGLAAVSENGRDWGFINKSGKKVVDFKYDEVYAFSEGRATVVKAGKAGLIDKSGDLIAPLIYDNEQKIYFTEGLGSVQLGEKWGFINEKGKLVIPAEYDHTRLFISQGLCGVTKGNAMGMIDKKGRVVIPFNYTVLADPSEGLIEAKKDGKWGYIDLEGKTVIPFKYDRISSFKGGEAKVTLNGNDYHINTKEERMGAGRWMLDYAKVSRYGKQFWSVNEEFPVKDIKAKWDEQYYITGLHYGYDKKWFLTMSKNSQFKNQMYRRRKTTDEIHTELNKMWSGTKPTHKNYAVTQLSYEDGEWLLIATESSALGEQTLSTSGNKSFLGNVSFPEEKMETNWGKGFFVTSLAYGDDTWALVMTKMDGISNQLYESFDYLPMEEIALAAKKDYIATQIGYDGEEWHVIFTKYKKGHKPDAQEFVVSETLPTRGINGFWEKGFTLLNTYSFERE